MARPKRPTIKPNLFPSDCAELIAAAIDRGGQAPELESAIGMLYMGHTFGWKVLYLFHSVATVEKYERILNIKVKERFEEATFHAVERSLAYKVLGSLSNFWRVVRGVDKHPEPRDKGILPA